MKAVVLGLAVSLIVLSSTLAQKQEQTSGSPSGQVLSYQVQPSEVEKAKTRIVQPQLRPQITYSGPLVAVARGENLLRPPPSTNVTDRPVRDDITVDVITRRPRGVVLFAINF